MFFDGIAAGTLALRVRPEWSPPTYRLVRILVIAFLHRCRVPYIPGSGSDAFKGSRSYGRDFLARLSSLIGNFYRGLQHDVPAGFSARRPRQIGAYMGVVEHTRLLVTHLRTVKNEEVVVPNSTILATEVVNYSSKHVKMASFCTPPWGSDTKRHGARWRPC